MTVTSPGNANIHNSTIEQHRGTYILLFCLFLTPNSTTVATSITTRSISKNPAETQTAMMRKFVWINRAVDWLVEGVTPRNEVANLDSSAG